MLSSDGGPAIFTNYNLKILKSLKIRSCLSIVEAKYENKNNNLNYDFGKDKTRS